MNGGIEMEQKYLDHHARVRSELSEIKGLAAKNDLKSYAKALIVHLDKLSGIMTGHFVDEYRYIFPMMKAKEGEIEEIARKLEESSRSVTSVFDSFRMLYNTESKILNDAESFAEQLEKISKKIENHFEQEAEKLYKNM